ncbi:hypothetical protein ACSV5K_16675 [Agrobacterium pusense]|uniref:hypothetical protein n=1 Tax=Agrobacterium pusense TaxID=648995 RepID=UPI003FD61328
MISNAIAFIDWNTQIHSARPRDSLNHDEVAKVTLNYVGKTLGRVLSREAPSMKFQLTLRLYHGWYKGYERTDRRKAITTVVAGADFPALSNKTSVSIRPMVEYGDNLYSAGIARFHDKHDCHLPNTLRKRSNLPNDFEEKMIDTAIASDVIDVAYREPATWLLLMGDDDDLVPPAMIAEGARRGGPGKVLLVRNRPVTKYLKLEGLSVCP